MQLGALVFPTEYSIGPAELAQAMEERGLEALVFPEHTHIPASRLTPYPSGGELPKEYAHTLDPFVACTAAAMATKTLRVGTGIALVVERDPILLAKEVATIDLLSGGRFDFGIGAGWNREEMANHGTDPRTRFALMEERVEAMRAIWTSEEASYHGRFVNFDRIWSWPKPIQKPHPPILLGGAGKTIVERAARYADVWMPISRTTPEAILETAPRLARACADRGRNTLPIYFYGAPTDAERLRAFAETPLERLYFWLPSAGKDTVLPLLDQIAGFRRILPG
ncbi:MAG: LLM class F420-dependent oxidoreductase [Actinomycetota bacterium]|nr:LLM class F420-dependent oxidoreductase [Actinomycetota bacterium]